MKKLLTLLNEFEKKRIEAVNAKWLPYNIKLSFRPYTERDLTNEAYRSCWLEICSKYYGFIKRLVDNDKIDTQNLITYMNWTSLTFNKVPSTDCASIDKTWNNFYTECLLMLLAIQDNPIEFLISILK